MALQDDIRQIEKIKEFQDGMKSQREHLNELVMALNKIIDSADRHAVNQALFGADGEWEQVIIVKAGVAYDASVMAKNLTEIV